MKQALLFLLFYPLIVTGQGIINNGANITISGSPYIVLNDASLNNAGSWLKGTETVVFSGAIAAELKGDASTYNNIEISNTTGITLNTSSVITCNNFLVDNGGIFNIGPTSKLTVSGTLTNNSTSSGLNIQSTTAGSGSLINSTAAVSARVQQIQLDPEAILTYYHIFSSPITNSTAAVLKFTNYHPILYDYVNTASPKWHNIIPSSTPLTVGKGYLLNYSTTGDDMTIVYSGPLNTGTVTYTVSSAGDGYSLVGNPYPCSLDWNVDDGSGWTRTNIDAGIYIWIPDSSRYGTYVKDAPLGTNGVTNLIASGQGYFVHATGSPSFDVGNGAKLHSNNILKSGQTDESYFRLKLTSATDPYSDETIFRFLNGATDKFEGNMEAVKFFSMNKEVSEIYSKTADSSNLSINALPDDYTDSIPLYFRCKKDGTFKLQINANNTTDTIYLYDLRKGTKTDLTHQNYEFTGIKDDNQARFIINRKKSSTGGGSLGTNVKETAKIVDIYSDGEIIHIQNKEDNVIKGNLTIFDSSGKIVYSNSVIFTNEYTKTLGTKGLYIVKLVYKNNLVTKKIVIY